MAAVPGTRVLAHLVAEQTQQHAVLRRVVGVALETGALEHCVVCCMTPIITQRSGDGMASDDLFAPNELRADPDC